VSGESDSDGDGGREEGARERRGEEKTRREGDGRP